MKTTIIRGKRVIRRDSSRSSSISIDVDADEYDRIVKLAQNGVPVLLRVFLRSVGYAFSHYDAYIEIEFDPFELLIPPTADVYGEHPGIIY